MKRTFAMMALISYCCLLPLTAAATVGAGVRVSTFGFGGDLDISASKWLTFRIGYHGINYGREINDTDVRYDGQMSISAASAILDWFVFGGGLRFSAGAVSNGPKVIVTGTPTNGSYTFNGNSYQASDIASLNGTITIGKSVAPYLGLGWGNVVGEKNSLTFLFDIGAMHTGTPTATLNVSCAPAVPSATCDQIAADANAEKSDLEDKARKYNWYPVIGIGFGVKFK